MLQRFTDCHWPNLILEKKIVLRNENERRCLGALYQDSGVLYLQTYGSNLSINDISVQSTL